MSMSEQKEDLLRDIKKSVNLPKTSFPMRANLAQNEPQTIKKWQKKTVYKQLLDKYEGCETFVFHDGPPYANGNIHVGHLLNKVLKDFVVRSQFLLGKRCPFTPGWDCHGLPIEHKVMQELTANGQIDKIKALDLDVQKSAIRNECKQYASKYIKLQAKQMQSLLTLADYDAPYLTMSKQFEASCLEVFAGLVKEGIVYRKLKPVHWSIANQTALAEAELEYYDRHDTCVYVGFKSQNSSELHRLFGSKATGDIYFLIWTTTPWTLPANLAVALHKTADYSLVSVSGRFYIIAKELINSVQQNTKQIIESLTSVKGEALLGQRYVHPFIEQESPVCHADYVSLDAGTGMVHIAPGHGVDDYLVGLEQGLEVYCPVKADGTYDDTAPGFLQGQLIWDANKTIVQILGESGHLFFDYVINHSYPHDWRSKTPVIFRSTEQWFISVDDALQSTNQSLRQMALNSIDNEIQFYPDWGRKRLRGMLESRPDWCISRQRSWGLPIPAFVSNSQLLLSEKSVLAISKLFAEEGSDAWFKKSAQELLVYYDSATDPYFPSGFDVSNAEKLYDIFDVWFESGSSWHEVLEKRQGQFPADLYLEGSDQHRGWFHLSLLPSLGIHKQAPYKRVLTHGFIVDKDGRKMSKSLGNALDVEELLQTYGAEVARWWVGSLSFENDIKVDLSYFDIAGESYRKVRNTIRFLLSNLNDCELIPIDTIQAVIMSFDETSLEHLMISELLKLDKSVKSAYQDFNFKAAHQEIYDFCNDRVSSFYCSIVKDCLYCDAIDSPDRIQVQYCFQIILEVLIRMLAPLLPHTADEAYQSLYPNSDSSVLLEERVSLSTTNNAEYWEPLLSLRQDVLRKLEESKKNGIENSLDIGLVLPKRYALYELAACRLEDFFLVSRVSFADTDSIIVQDLRDFPRCERSWKRDETVQLRSNDLYLSDRDAAVLGLK